MRWAPPAGLFQSIRFRLTVVYSAILFALTVLVLGTVYVVVSRSTDARPITRTYEAEAVIHRPDGSVRQVGTLTVAEVRDIELAVNYETLRTLRTYAAPMAAGLFAASLVIGWVLSGRALRPVRSITRTAEEIQATDLSRRIRLGGPGDELRELADTIDSMLERLDRTFRAQRQLIDDVSHELRTPLTLIRANLDATFSDPAAGEDERARAATMIDHATTRMTRLIEDMLATARRTSAAHADTDVDLAAVAREAGEEAAPLAAARQLTLAYDLEDGLVALGEADALRRAVGNLLDNAARLAPAGSTVRVATGRRDGWLSIAVADQGPGIAPEDQPLVFDRFWRGAGTRAGRGAHAGLGLAIVRQIVEGHGGHVRLHSSPGVGSTFVLWLPDRGRQPGPLPTAPPERLTAGLAPRQPG
jgi:signal transduction histidine kinase